MDNLEKYNDIFCDVFGVDVEQLNDTFTFGCVKEWDSVAHMNLISELEDTFDVMFETEDILHYGSYLNGIEILKKYDVKF